MSYSNTRAWETSSMLPPLLLWTRWPTNQPEATAIVVNSEFSKKKKKLAESTDQLYKQAVFSFQLSNCHQQWYSPHFRILIGIIHLDSLRLYIIDKLHYKTRKRRNLIWLNYILTLLHFSHTRKTEAKVCNPEPTIRSKNIPRFPANSPSSSSANRAITRTLTEFTLIL